MESSELAAAASQRVSLPSGGDNFARRALLQWLSRQVGFSRLRSFPFVGCPMICSSPSGAARSVAYFLGQAKQWTSI